MKIKSNKKTSLTFPEVVKALDLMCLMRVFAGAGK